MEQQSIEKMLLSLQEEVRSLKFLNGGGAISDLVTRVSALENKKCQLFPKGNYISLYENVLGTEIIPGWTAANQLTRTISVPADGLLNIYAHFENRDMQDNLIAGTAIGVYLNNLHIFSCKSTPGANVHCEDSNSITFPVQAGATLTLKGGSISPNGSRNELLIHLWPY